MHSGWDKRNGRVRRFLSEEEIEVGWQSKSRQGIRERKWVSATGSRHSGVRTFADIEYLGPSITLGVAISESIGLTFVSISGTDLWAAHVGLDCDHRSISQSTTLGDLHHISLLTVDDRAIFHRHFCSCSLKFFYYNLRYIWFCIPLFANWGHKVSNRHTRRFGRFIKLAYIAIKFLRY